MTEFVAPPRPYAGNRDLFVFVDAGPAGLKRHAVIGFWEEALSRYFETNRDPKPWDQAMKALYEKHRPKTIALSIDGKRGVTVPDPLQLRLPRRGDGPGGEGRASCRRRSSSRSTPTRGCPRRRRCTGRRGRWSSFTASLARRALSSEVIRPGTTRVGDVRRWLFDRAWDLGVSLWFQPDLRVQRKGQAPEMSRGFLAISDEGVVIERGDVVHLDFGFTFMGLNTDYQRMAYVLRDAEEDGSGRPGGGARPHPDPPGRR